MKFNESYLCNNIRNRGTSHQETVLVLQKDSCMSPGLKLETRANINSH